MIAGLYCRLSVLYPFERNYMIRKAEKDPMFMERIKTIFIVGEIKAAINYCRTMNSFGRMIERYPAVWDVR